MEGGKDIIEVICGMQYENINGKKGKGIEGDKSFP